MSKIYQCGTAVAVIGSNGNTATVGVGDGITKLQAYQSAIADMSDSPLSIYDSDRAVLDWVMSSWDADACGEWVEVEAPTAASVYSAE